MLAQGDAPAAPWYAAETHGGAAVGRQRPKGLGMLIFVLVLLAGSVSLAAFVTVPERPRTLVDGSIALPASLDDVVAGCTGPVLRNRSSDRLPPAAGDWTTPAAPTGFYPVGAADTPTVSETVASLIAGQVVIWYSPTIKPERYTALKNIVAGSPDARDLTVLPWPAGWQDSDWERNRAITLTAWGVTQGCDVASDAVLTTFIRTYAGAEKA